MSRSGNRSTIPFILVLLIGVVLILYLFMGPELFKGGFSRVFQSAGKGWDPITPVMNALADFGNAIGNFFSNLFR